MTDTPDKTEGEAERTDALIDAVVSDAKPAETPADTPAPAEPASAGGKKKKKPEPTTFGGKLWHGWIKPIGTVFLIVALLRSTIIDWNDVPTGSMEPTILVGDRILVNKMAYALQVPLSGPKIGVPFTAMQWDNPLDGLPAWHWGNPRRGDIVTFWNPVTGVRMVKRIVAEPGDTIEMRGGIMTLTPAGGTPTTATYVDNPSPVPPDTIVGYTKQRVAITQDRAEREETLLGETRTIQHIPERWTWSWGLLRMPDGRAYPVADGRVGVAPNGRAYPSKMEDTDDGRVLEIQGEGIPLASVTQGEDTGILLLQIREGMPYIDGEEASYNDFATAYLQPLEALGPVDVVDGHTLEVRGHEWLIDGEPVAMEYVGQLITQADADTLGPEVRRLATAYAVLRDHLMTSSFGPITLGDDQYYMIGDNRNNSHDSRYFGPVARSEITGEAVAIPVSFNGRIRDLSPRWSRWFHGLD